MNFNDICKPESLPRHSSGLAEERVPRAGAAAAERGGEEEARHGGQGRRQKEEGRLVVTLSQLLRNTSLLLIFCIVDCHIEVHQKMSVNILL